MTLYGELSLWDASGKAVLRARTIFYNRSNPGAGHAPGRRQIGLSEGDFPYFVQMIDRETPSSTTSGCLPRHPRSRHTEDSLLRTRGPTATCECRVARLK